MEKVEADAGGRYGQLLGSFIGGFYGRAYKELHDAGIPEDQILGIANLLLNNAIDRIMRTVISSAALQSVVNENALVKQILDNPVGGEQ